MGLFTIQQSMEIALRCGHVNARAVDSHVIHKGLRRNEAYTMVDKVGVRPTDRPRVQISAHAVLEHHGKIDPGLPE